MRLKEAAMIELTEAQLNALDAESEPRVRDPHTNTVYILVRADVYERTRELLNADFHPSEAYPAIDRAFSEAWNDPKMDDYDRYEERKK
jgi:hypothetical protein